MYLGRDRKLNRWMGYDYNTPGWYFITICTKDRVECLCNIENGVVVLTKIGEIVRDQLLWLAKQYDYIKLDEWVIMPNHLHVIIELQNENYYKLKGNGTTVGNGRDRSLHDCDNHKIKPLPEIIGAFKTTSSKLIHRNGHEYFQWQKSFHDRVIRNDNEYYNYKYYIQQNPFNWSEDRNNPKNL